MGLSARSALIIGASRGLGLTLALELVHRGWEVIGTVRGASGQFDAAVAADTTGRLQAATVDMNNAEQLSTLRGDLEGRRFDLIFVNAAINLSAGSLDKVSMLEFIEVMVTNAFSPIRALESMHDLVAPAGTVVVMSSEQGSITRNDDAQFDVYKASKAALNQLMTSYANRHADDGHTKLLIDPGHNKTELGGADAPLDPSESIPLVVDVVEANAGRGGLQFLDRHGAVVPW